MSFNHAAVLGETRSGKTYFSNHKLHKSFKGVSVFCHFYDSMTDIAGFTADKTDSAETLKAGIRKGAKINYELASNPRQAVNEIGLIYNICKQSGKHCQILIDESHRLIPEGARENIIDDAIRDGLKHKVRLVLISQSPADIRKASLKQVDTIYIFRLNEWENLYFKNYGFNPDKIKNMTAKKYSFVKAEFGKLHLNKV